MGAWAYCRCCDNPLKKPTFRELWDGEQLCNNGHTNTPTGDMGEELDELIARLGKLEADNKLLKRRMARVFGILDSIGYRGQSITEIIK